MNKKMYDEPEFDLIRLQFDTVLQGSTNNPYNPEIGEYDGDEGGDGNL